MKISWNLDKSVNPWCILGDFPMLQLIHVFVYFNDSHITALSHAWIFATLWCQEWQLCLLSQGILSRALFLLFVWRYECKDTFTIILITNKIKSDAYLKPLAKCPSVPLRALSAQLRITILILGMNNILITVNFKNWPKRLVKNGKCYTVSKNPGYKN